GGGESEKNPARPPPLGGWRTGQQATVPARNGKAAGPMKRESGDRPRGFSMNPAPAGPQAEPISGREIRHRGVPEDDTSIHILLATSGLRHSCAARRNISR